MYHVTLIDILKTDPMESISSPGSRGKGHQLGLHSFSFFLSGVSRIKAKRGGRPDIFTGMKPLKIFYIICSTRRAEVKISHLFLYEIDYLHPSIFFGQW